MAGVSTSGAQGTSLALGEPPSDPGLSPARITSIASSCASLRFRKHASPFVPHWPNTLSTTNSQALPRQRCYSPFCFFPTFCDAVWLEAIVYCRLRSPFPPRSCSESRISASLCVPPVTVTKYLAQSTVAHVLKHMTESEKSC
uniref:Uncharacterized protein n=1 Tax=Myotis myotis TaxID=51298 RepID=A0A7J7RD09_MYOMY|nr:hypothetical protein mMyoMyo1_010819 [Myotis myotis]